MTIAQPLIVVTDLDGTLLDHETYKYDSAKPAIDYLKQLNIPLVFNSSKTAAEIIHLSKEMNSIYPFIVENGAGIYLPSSDVGNDYEIISFGKKRAEILSTLKILKDKYALSYIGFNDMSDGELMSQTGLTQDQAKKAQQRDFTEPLKWTGDDRQWKMFCTEIERAGLTAVRGGRFTSISGKVNKGQAMQWLRHYYAEQMKTKPLLIALGDSENDREMLQNADYPVLVRSDAHALPRINANNLIVTDASGPEGWNDSIIELLKQFNLINKG